MNAIETHGLVKKYGNFEAVKGLDLNVKEGAVYGFLGPNGAGKSTTISMLMGFIRPTSGSATVMGFEVEKQLYEIRKVTGYLPERPAFYESLSGRKNLRYFGKLMGMEDLEAGGDELLKMVGLEGRGDDRVSAYSHGMRQRLGIAIAMLGNPKLLILDEPSTGLDPQGSHDVREIIKKLKDEKTTIFLSSHMLHEVQEICDTVGIIKNGQLIVEKPIDSFLRSAEGNLSMVEVSALNLQDSYLEVVKKIKGVESATINDHKMVITISDPSAIEDINMGLVAAGCRVREVKEIKPTLEDAFLKVTSEGKVEG